MNICLCKKATLLACALVVLCEFGWNEPARAFQLGAGFDLDVTLSAMSDYRDTGISQTRGDPALQAEAIVQHASGLYAGVFMSNVDFGNKARREDMYFVGALIPLGEEVTLDTYIGRYEYPKEAYSDYNEFFAELAGYGFQLGYTYGFDNRGHVPNNSNVYLAYNFELPYEAALQVRYGYSNVRVDAFWSASGDSRKSYHDWEARLSRNILGVDVFASYVDTDLSKAECYSASGFDDICSATLVVGVSKTF